MRDLPNHRLLAVVIAALLGLVIVPAAYAQGDSLEVSLDGTSWSRTLPDALFEDDILLVPGESVSTRLHLRSAAPTTGVLEAELKNVSTSDDEAAGSFGFQIEAVEGRNDGVAVGGLPRTRFADLDEGTRLGAPLRLEPGETVTLVLTIDLDEAAAGNGSQNSSIGLDLALTFTDALAVSGASGGGSSSGHGHGTVPEHVIPVLGAGQSATPATQEGSSGGGAEPTVLEDPRTLSTHRGLLAVTGTSALGVLVIAGAALLAGGALRLHSRRRAQETS